MVGDAQHFNWIVEISFRQPDGKIAGHYSDEIRFENISAADAEEAGEKAVEIYQASAERLGLVDIRVMSVRRQQTEARRSPPSGTIFPRG